MSIEADAQIVSVVGGCRRAGRWLVPAKTTVMTFFGRATIDLREAETTAESLTFKVTSAFASVTFIVPEGAEVRPSGMAILASARSDVPVDPGGCHLPKIAIDAVAAFGRFRVITDAELEADEEAATQQVAQVVDVAPVAPTSGPAHAAVDDGPVDMVGSIGGAGPQPPAHAADPPPASPRSPIHDITVPDSLAGVGLDDLPAPFPTDLGDAAPAEPDVNADAG